MKAEHKGFSRREFLDRTSKVAGGAVALSALSSCANSAAAPMAMGKSIGANDRINMAVVGIRGRGGGLLNNFADIKGVHIKTVCDVDEKVMDDKFLGLIGRLLKAGVEIGGAVHPTVKGVPQGGVVTPQTILQNAG